MRRLQPGGERGRSVWQTEQSKCIGGENLVAIYHVSDRVVYKINVDLWIDWNRPEIGSKQYVVNAAHFDCSLETAHAWTHKDSRGKASAITSPSQAGRTSDESLSATIKVPGLSASPESYHEAKRASECAPLHAGL